MSIERWCKLNHVGRSSLYVWLARSREEEPGRFPRRNAATLNWIELTRGGLVDSKLRRRAQELALQRCAARRAGVYSVTTTGKANGLNPRLYVEWLLTEMPNAGELTDEVVDSFLPWSDRVPESCKLDSAAAEKAKEMPDDFIINIDPDAFDDEMANNAEEGL